MAVGYNPRAITDGLVLSLDAGSPKNYNVGISTNWTDKVGGNNGTLVGGTHHNDGPFVGAGYVEFDGTGDYLSVPDDASLDMGSSDFTIEGWYFPLGNAPHSTAIFSKRASSYNVGGVLVYYGANGLTPSLLVDIGGTWAINTASSVSFVANQWNHFAVTRNGSAFNLYINGVSGVSASNAGSIPDNSYAFVIGAMGEDGSGVIPSCYISNVRVVKGTALYTSNFTPPTKSLTAVTNTKLLTCQGNTIADASSSAHTLTANGTAAANLGFPASAFVFDGTNDYVEVARSDDFDFGTGNLTIESWVYINEYNSEGNMLVYKTQSSGSAGNACGNYVASNGLLSMSASDNTTYQVNVSGGTVTLGTWHHICMTRVGSTWTCYLNTTQVSTATWAGSVSHVTTGTFGGIGMGAYTSAYGGNTGRYSMNGKISGVKIYKGKGLTAAEVLQNYNATKGRYA